MSDEYNGIKGLKAFGFAVGVTVVILGVLYLVVLYKAHRPLFGRGRALRNFSQRPGGPNNPLETENDRSGGEPRVCDVCITSWYPLCSQPEFRSGRSRLDKDQKCAMNCTTNDQKRARWREILVSRVYPIGPFRSRVVSLHLILGYSATVCR